MAIAGGVAAGLVGGALLASALRKYYDFAMLHIRFFR